MIAVIFEVEPHPEQTDRYFELAQQLGEALAQQEGFISVERFQSVSQPGRFVSLSFWRDEAAAQQWRAHALHRQAQIEGRHSVFAHYRLRVASVLRDYGLHERAQAPCASPDALG
jgi:heme-degrading monooxygenase HmoA